MGAEVAAALAASMAGPLPETARRVEPLAWRPLGAAAVKELEGAAVNEMEGTAAVEAMEEELERFVAAAQREVAGLPDKEMVGRAVDEGAEAAEGRLRVQVTVHSDLGAFMASKPSLSVASSAEAGTCVVVGAHAFLEPEWSAFERPLAQAAGGVYTYVHEAHDEGPSSGKSSGGSSGQPLGESSGEMAAVARAQLLAPTLCLKLKRREAIESALRGAEAAEGVNQMKGTSPEVVNQVEALPDQAAARRVNRLACRWAASATAASAADASEAAASDALAPPPAGLPPRWRLLLADDRELLDAPDGPFGNKGGLYIESRVRIAAAEAATKPGAEPGAEAAARDDSPPVLRVSSPTITTPLEGVPEPFLAGHYMKVLCPVGGSLDRVTLCEPKTDCDSD